MVWSDSGDTSDFSEYSVIGDSGFGSKLGVKKYPCTYSGCRLVFSRPYRLAAHLCVHTGEKPFPCHWEGCNKAYTNKSHLTRHVRAVHQKIVKTRDYLCKSCSQVFSNFQNLRKHTSRLHQSKYPYYCDICETGYRKKNVLAQHMFYHTGQHPFKCNLCSQSFSELIQFNKHKRNHKTFKCICKEVFTRWSGLLKHKKTVHEPSEFICDNCQKCFKSRVAIIQHIKSHSADKTVFQCSYDGCPKFYSTKYNLMFHIQSFHENLTFNCTIEGCNAKLSTKSKLLYHISKHTNTKRAPKKHKQPRERNRRKDFGTFKRSTALKLAGLRMPALNEKRLVERQIDSHTESLENTLS